MTSLAQGASHTLCWILMWQQEAVNGGNFHDEIPSLPGVKLYFS